MVVCYTGVSFRLGGTSRHANEQVRAACWGYTDFSSIYVNEYGMGDARELGVTLFHESYHILNPTHTDAQAEAAAQACFS